LNESIKKATEYLKKALEEKNIDNSAKAEIYWTLASL
jgi:hypothetical protein